MTNTDLQFLKDLQERTDNFISFLWREGKIQSALLLAEFSANLQTEIAELQTLKNRQF